MTAPTFSTVVTSNEAHYAIQQITPSGFSGKDNLNDTFGSEMPWEFRWWDVYAVGGHGGQNVLPGGTFIGQYVAPFDWTDSQASNFLQATPPNFFTQGLTAGMSTFDATLIKQTLKALAAGMSTFNGALVKQTLKTLTSGMATFAGTLTKQTSHFLTSGMATFSAGTGTQFTPGVTAGGGIRRLIIRLRGDI